MKNIINSYKTRLKATVDENVDLKNLNESMKLQLEETTAELLDLKIEVKSLKIWKDVKTNHTVETFTRTKSGRRKYDMTTDMKYNAIVQKIREKFSSFSAMQVVELEEQVFDDFKDESDDKGTIVVPVRGWTGRAEIVNGGENAGTLVSIASNDEYVATCPLMTAMKHGMYAPSFSSFEEQISLFVNEVLMTDLGEAVKEAKKVEECTKQISNDKALQKELKSRLSNALGTRKKAARNRFVNILGYTMFSTRSKNRNHGQKAKRKNFQSKKKNFKIS